MKEDFLHIFLIILTFSSCTISLKSKSKIEITQEYVYNPHWSDYNNAIKIERMNTKDSIVLDATSPAFRKEIVNNWDLNDKLVVDKTFVYSYNGLSYFDDYIKLKDTLFFNKSNGFYWNLGETYIGNKKTSKRTIGVLENERWYKLSHLVTRPFYIYTYIDSNGKAHNFRVDMSNY